MIDQHGGVAKCQMEIERPVTSVHAADPLGIIRADTIGVRNLPVQEKEGCRDCAWQLWCAGGCAVATFRATGRYDVVRRTAGSTPRSIQRRCGWKGCGCSSMARANT